MKPVMNERIEFNEEDLADLDVPEEDQGNFDPTGEDAIAVVQSLLESDPHPHAF